MNSVHYNIGGLAGPESKTRVKNALNKIEGVQKIIVDVPRGTIEVKFNEKTSEGEIRNSIENTGYTIE